MEENKVQQKVASLNKESEEKDYQSYADKLGLDFIDLKNYPISKEVLNLIPYDQADKYQVISYLRAANKVKIATINPEDKEFISFINSLAKANNFEFIIGVTTPSDIAYSLKLYDLTQTSRRVESDVIEITEEEKNNFEKNIKNLRDVTENLKKVSVTYILDLLLTGAIKTEASDIHIEPDEKEAIVRYRIDGVLHPIISMESETASHIISRIKLMSKMKIDTLKMPQDGKFFIRNNNKRVDIRVSTLPEAYGESLVLRILDKEAAMLRLEDLGLSKEESQKIEKAYQKTNGLFFVTGPTGSGKTTTLYAILDKLNKPGVKIITLEDPIEYDLPGIIQSQVDQEKNYTFSAGLRAILRQDPDIVLIGEIRDAETGEMATQASLTGHLVLSTLHTNDAPSALHRLLDLGIRPFMIIDSINMIMAQRLIRRICKNCKEEYIPEKFVTDEIKRILGKNTKVEKLYRGKGCDQCHQSGFKGRVGIFEFLVLNEELKKLTLRMATLDEIKEEAIKTGMETLEINGLKKALNGLTTPEEVWRVTKG